MTLQRAYLLLCGFYTLLIAIGALALTLGAGGPLHAVQVAVGAVAVAGLWGQTLGRGVGQARLWRPLAGLLAAGVLLQCFAMLSLPLSGSALTWSLAGAIFAVLPAIVLYRYGNRDQPLWATPAEREWGARLAARLADQPTLVLVQGSTEARLEAHDDGYQAHITRPRQGTPERFTARFQCPATLVFFLEKFADLDLATALDTASAPSPSSADTATPAAAPG